MRIVVEHYDAERVPNPNPRGATQWRTFAKVRTALVDVCRKFGVTGPDDTSYPYTCDFYVVDDQYNDELYQYFEVYNREVLTAKWLEEMMAALRRFPGWGAGLKNLRFAYLLIFGRKLMVTGCPFAGCDDVHSVAVAASASLWGVNGEEERYTWDHHNRDELLAAKRCGCYHCCAMFAPSAIAAWADENDEGIGQTAVCPKCGKTNVIAAKPRFSLQRKDLVRLSESAYGPLAKRSR
jgi:hypothetical protein